MAAAAIVMFVSAVFVLVYGTCKRIEAAYESDRPTALGGDLANTGDTYDTDHKTTLLSKAVEDEHSEIISRSDVSSLNYEVLGD